MRPHKLVFVLNVGAQANRRVRAVVGQQAQLKLDIQPFKYPLVVVDDGRQTAFIIRHRQKDENPDVRVLEHCTATTLSLQLITFVPDADLLG